MSEPPPDFDPNDLGDDRTQPSTEILSALETLNSTAIQEDAATTEYDSLHATLRENPRQPDVWRRLVDLAESDGDPEKVKETYDALLTQYPNTSSAQIAYLTHFVDPAPSQFAEDLFKRFLRSSPSVDLWRYYLTYVRRVNQDPSTRDMVRKSYEFALNHVGQDKDSGEMWSDYIQFLKSRETNTTWEEQQKMDALRKVYHRAVQIPLDNVERLWHEYEAWESNLNKITAKKFMADLSPSHMQARTVLRQLQKHLAPLFPPLPATTTNRPPLFIPALPTFNLPERSLVGSWKNYLKWEESNPLEIEDKDKQTLITRVQGVYRKALIRMRFYSEIWYMAFVYSASIGKSDEALEILKQGLEANPTSFLLTFAYVEQQEIRKEFADVHATFDKFLTALRSELVELEARVKSANSSIASISSNETILVATVIKEENSGSFGSQSSDETNKPPRSKEFADRRTEYGLAWIMYMRFGRRAENVKSSRSIFGKARREPLVPWEVYEAAALMEYHGTAIDGNQTQSNANETSRQAAIHVASRIFEKGMSIFGDEIEYVLRHLGFLISVNDENNARALFERVITTFPPDKARPLWERWARYEYQYGDLEAAHRLEKRIAEVYPSDPPIKRFAQRHIYLGTDAIAARDLGFAMARSSGNSLARTETQQSLQLASAPNVTPTGTSHKRPSSPDYRNKRGADDVRAGVTNNEYHNGPAPKRARPMSPPRWEGGARRRFSPAPVYDRDRDRERDRDRDIPPPRRGDRERDREEEKGPVLPSILSWFVEKLPMPQAFDGPVFRTDDLMHLFRNAVIPSTSGTRSRSPPPVAPPRTSGRPPPDYSPYQGPGGGRGGRRY